MPASSSSTSLVSDPRRDAARPVEALATVGVVKSYPGVRALRGVDFRLAPGEVRALLGKNGAGKSTLVKVLSGAEQPDAGTVRLRGAAVTLASPFEAQAMGIATVWQELSLVDSLSVAENITLGHWKTHRPLGTVSVIDRRAIVDRAAAALSQLGSTIDPRRLVSRLGLADRQIVEIAKALAARPDVLILDEPTSSLPTQEVDALLPVVRRLSEAGVAVIYVSHRMREIPQVADTLTVLRDGTVAGPTLPATASLNEITELMVGGASRLIERPRGSGRGSTSTPVALAVRGLADGDRLRDVSFELHRGEVLGIAGLLGSGRSEILRALFGVHPVTAGIVEVDGRRVTRRSPSRLRALGVGLMPEDRGREGLVHTLSVAENATMAAPRRVSARGIISSRRRRALSLGMIDDLAIAVTDPDVRVGTLSGGNQQKVVLAKWLNAQVEVLLMDEPDRGVDIQAKEQIQALVRRLASDGMSVLVASSELEDLMTMCDRILVLNHGRITTSLTPGETTVGALLSLAMQASDEDGDGSS